MSCMETSSKHQQLCSIKTCQDLRLYQFFCNLGNCSGGKVRMRKVTLEIFYVAPP